MISGHQSRGGGEVATAVSTRPCPGRCPPAAPSPRPPTSITYFTVPPPAPVRIGRSVRRPGGRERPAESTSESQTYRVCTTSPTFPTYTSIRMRHVRVNVPTNFALESPPAAQLHSASTPYGSLTTGPRPVTAQPQGQPRRRSVMRLCFPQPRFAPTKWLKALSPNVTLRASCNVCFSSPYDRGCATASGK